jgi:hypothetical protein
MRTALFLLAICSTAALAEGDDLGAKLPENAKKVADHRFRSPTDWNGTLKYYKGIYGSSNFPRKAIINQPNVRAVHIVNASGKGQWAGLNIYETNSEVRITVIAADAPVAK